MKILVFGATGKTGKELLSQALEQDFEVTAFARNPQDIAIQHDRLKVVKGDILDYVTVDSAVNGQDAVISALGIRTLKKNTIISEGTKNIVNAMKKHAVRRFVCMSSVGVGDSRQQQGALGFLYNRILIPYLLKDMFGDKEVQERYIKESGLLWTIVRPVILTNGKRTGEYRTFLHDDTTIRPRISRADVADFLLEQLTDKRYINSCVSISE